MLILPFIFNGSEQLRAVAGVLLMVPAVVAIRYWWWLSRPIEPSVCHLSIEPFGLRDKKMSKGDTMALGTAPYPPARVNRVNKALFYERF